MLDPARRSRSCRELEPMLELLEPMLELLLEVTRMAEWLLEVTCMVELELPRRRRRRLEAPALALELELELAEPVDMASGVIPVSMGATATATVFSAFLPANLAYTVPLSLPLPRLQSMSPSFVLQLPLS